MNQVHNFVEIINEVTKLSGWIGTGTFNSGVSKFLSPAISTHAIRTLLKFSFPALPSEPFSISTLAIKTRFFDVLLGFILHKNGCLQKRTRFVGKVLEHFT